MGRRFFVCVRAWERWHKSGEAPNESLKGVFAKFKVWLNAIYDRLRDKDGNMIDGLWGYKPFTPEVIELLKRYYGDVSDLTGQPTGSVLGAINEQH